MNHFFHKIRLRTKIVLCIASIIGLFLATRLYTVSNQECLLQAHQWYEKKQFTKALDAYTQIHNKGCPVWYNMGNCAYQLEQFDNACVYWLRAYKGANKKQVSAIKKNIHALESKLGTAIDLSLFDSALCDTPLFLLQILFLLLWVIFLWASISWYRKKRYALIFIFIVVTGVIGIGLFLKYKTVSTNYAVIKKDACLLAGPNSNYHTTGMLKHSQVVVVSVQNNGWCKIKSKNAIGWIASDKLIVI